ncbi:DUF4336 domain-containing protein [Stakelama sp. CBK3Z-3]|uniref:DUF4336 domain-containing protein n=2 Tax=Stakelama flava TaxID=2860338 RepID=A0ABS6XPF6_9SPHN|nr:DUF4336 domain-containing protein [Stakelama flava]
MSGRPAFDPYTPLMVLKPFADDIWTMDGPEIRMNWLGLKIPFTTRMTLVRLPDGGIWVHSPTGQDGMVMDAVESLGPVRHLVAPNSIHYWWLPQWHARFPDARVHGVAGLSQKAKRHLPPLEVLRATAPTGWAGTIDQVIVPGDVVTEADFFHRPSRTLILTDLIENFEPQRIRSRVLRFLMRLTGAVDPDGQAPIDLRATFWRHRASVRAAVEQMIEWEPDHIILAHGRCYDKDGVGELRRSFRWVL